MSDKNMLDSNDKLDSEIGDLYKYIDKVNNEIYKKDRKGG